MTDRELEHRLAQAVRHAAPDDLKAVLSRCGAQNGSVMELKELKSNQNVIDVEVTEVKSKGKLRPWLAAACAALVLLGAGGGGLVYSQSYAVASIVSLDVNPSIELTVNRGGRVISCSALNEEAAAVLFSMSGGADLKGAKLDVAVNAIVGALVQAGYMDSISSAILISVEDSDQARAARLQQELVASVDGVLRVQAPNTSVLSQVLTVNAGTQASSGVSAGKAALVQKVLDMNGAGDKMFDQLAALSVEELNDLLEAGERRIPIGKSAAAAAAEEYAGTLALDSVVADVDPELDKNPSHYEVKLKTAWGEFEYMVDAFTGEVLSGQKNLLNTTGPNSQGTAGTMLTDTQAFNAAAEHFGVQYPALSGNNILNTLTKLDWENGRQVYDVDFIVSGYEFEYVVDAYTGAVLKWDTDYRTSAVSDPAPTVPGTSSGTASSSSQDVGQEAAKQAALEHAGLTEGEVTGLWIERDWDDGRLEYDVEFWCGSTEYDYTIDGHSCSILKHEWDHHEEYNWNHHDDPNHSGTAVPSGDIGQEAAKAAALNHAGVSESQTAKMKVERDWDDGRLEYEVEFSVGRTEYEYTIDGVTGAVLEYERDED